VLVGLGVARHGVGGMAGPGGIVIGGVGRKVKHLPTCTMARHCVGGAGAGAGCGELRRAGLQHTGLGRVRLVWGVAGTCCCKI
jgi:hypothetical protein